MNVQHILIAAAFAGAAAAHAETPSAMDPAPFQPRLSRAEVVRNLAAARATGQVQRGEAQPTLARSGSRGRSRADVAAEAVQASRSGSTSRGELSAIATQAEGRAVRF